MEMIEYQAIQRLKILNAWKQIGCTLQILHMDGKNRSRSWLEPSAILDPRSNANACQEPESSVQRAQCGTCI